MRELLRRQQVALSTKKEIDVKREEIKGERGVKREYDEEYEELMRSAITKKVKTRTFEHGETIELDWDDMAGASPWRLPVSWLLARERSIGRGYRANITYVVTNNNPGNHNFDGS